MRPRPRNEQNVKHSIKLYRTVVGFSGGGGCYGRLVLIEGRSVAGNSLWVRVCFDAIINCWITNYMVQRGMGRLEEGRGWAGGPSLAHMLWLLCCRVADPRLDIDTGPPKSRWQELGLAADSTQVQARAQLYQVAKWHATCGMRARTGGRRRVAAVVTARH